MTDGVTEGVSLVDPQSPLKKDVPFPLDLLGSPEVTKVYTSVRNDVLSWSQECPRLSSDVTSTLRRVDVIKYHSGKNSYGEVVLDVTISNHGRTLTLMIISHRTRYQ